MRESKLSPLKFNLLVATLEKEWKDKKTFTAKEVEILKRKDAILGRTVAHELAARGFNFTDQRILRIANSWGWTVTHEVINAVKNPFMPRRWKEVLIAEFSKKTTKSSNLFKLATKEGLTVAHVAALVMGLRFDDPEILKLATNEGFTVAHAMARRGYKFTDPEILKIANNYGWAVAHEMAEKGHVFDDFEILRLTTDRGWTVAHEMAAQGCVFVDPEVLNLSDKSGITVKDVIEKKHGKKLEEVLKDNFKRSEAAKTYEVVKQKVVSLFKNRRKNASLKL
jgi:hypothetical protein